MEERVKQFLAQWSAAVRDNGATFIRTEKNVETMLKLLMTKEELETDLVGLSVNDYSMGPEADDDSTKGGEVWVFGVELKNREVYIKIKLAETDEGPLPKCISFHFAERRMHYPLRSPR